MNIKEKNELKKLTDMDVEYRRELRRYTKNFAVVKFSSKKSKISAQKTLTAQKLLPPRHGENGNIKKSHPRTGGRPKPAPGLGSRKPVERKNGREHAIYFSATQMKLKS